MLMKFNHGPTINIPAKDGKPSYDSARAGVSIEFNNPHAPGTPEFDAVVKKHDILIRFMYLQRLSWELGFVEDVRDLGITGAMRKEWECLGVHVDNE